MAFAEEFDALILGSGQGGNPLAAAMTKAGKRTALIERQDVGGTCINTGCTPTKTMVASARIAYMARRAGDYGIAVHGVSVQMDRVRERKRGMVNSFRGGSERKLESAHVELIRGEASFAGPREIDVTLATGAHRRLTAPYIFIDTGTRSSEPSIDGLKDLPYLNNESIMELDRVPEHLLVLGGGYVGLEFAQMFRRFGSNVTVLQSSSQLLPREDSDVAGEILNILREDGISVILNARTEAAIPRDARAANPRGRNPGVRSPGVSLRVRAGVDETAVRTVEGTDLLVATGRAPNTGALNLAAAGIGTDERGFIRVNERLETTAAGIYAMGDVNGGPMFTHIAYDDYRILEANLLKGGARTVNDRMVPYTVFLDPQLGRIGMTEAQARHAGIGVKVAKMPMSHVARALEAGESRGIMKVVVNAATEEILGAAVLGYEGGEVMSVLEVAMMGKLKYPVLRDAVFAHPTLSESLNNLFFHFEEEKA